MITHLKHTDAVSGMQVIEPLHPEQFGFCEKPDGTACVVRVHPTFQRAEVKERFADILERMVRAGLCLDLGSTGPTPGDWWHKTHAQPHDPASDFMDFSRPLVVETSRRYSELLTIDSMRATVERLRDTIAGMDAELAALRSLAKAWDTSRDLVRKCGDLELEACADASDVAGMVWSLVLIALPRGKLLQEGNAHAVKMNSRMEALEAKLNAHRIQDAAAVRQLQAVKVALSAMLMVNHPDIDETMGEIRTLADNIAAFLVTLEHSATDE